MSAGHWAVFLIGASWGAILCRSYDWWGVGVVAPLALAGLLMAVIGGRKAAQ